MRYTAQQHLEYMSMCSVQSQQIACHGTATRVVIALPQISGGEKGSYTTFTEFVSAVWDQTYIYFILL